MFYLLRAGTLSLLGQFLKSHASAEARSMGAFVQWLVSDQERTFYGMKLPTGFQLIGSNTTLKDYLK